MAGKLVVTLRERTFHFEWCNQTVKDCVCLTCESIVTGDTCLHCERARQKKQESLRKFLESRQEG